MLLRRASLGLEVNEQPAGKRSSRAVWLRLSCQLGGPWLQECAQRSQEKRMPRGGCQKVPGSCWGGGGGWRMWPSRGAAGGGWRMWPSGAGRTEASRSFVGKSPRELTELRRGLCLDGAGGLHPHLGDLPQFTSPEPWIFTASCSWVPQGIQNIPKSYQAALPGLRTFLLEE